MLKHRKAHERQADINISIADSVLLDAYMDKTSFCHPESGHETDTRFYNQQPKSPARGSKELLRWLVTRESFTWKVDIQNEYETRVNTAVALPQNRPQADLDDWQVWFVGHATVLVQIGPYNFITDPVWCDYASPSQGRGPRRVCPAGFALEQLPTIHGVLLSHNHYDHMDLATLEWLHKNSQCQFTLDSGMVLST